MIRVLALLALIGALVFGYVFWRILNVQLKSGASIENVSWRMFWVAICADIVFAKRGQPAVITSGADGTHKRTSKHYPENNASGMVEALDLRTRHVDDPEECKNELQAMLGPDYQVIFEGDHLHAEYDPRG
jgi:hypothetical protein